jgi:predicted DNA-binding transcriptional regulator AlpA
MVIEEQDKRVLTQGEVARFLKVSVGTVKRWRLEGRGPKYSRLGGRLPRYRMTDIEAYLEATRVPGNE